MTLAGKRILLVLDSLELGGAERQALHAARHFRQCERAEVAVWGFGPPGRVTELCQRVGLPCRSVPLAWHGARLERLSSIAALGIRIRRWRPDAILSYCAKPNVVCGLVWQWTGAAACVWNQRDEGLDLGSSRLARWAVARVPVLVSNSHHGAAFLRREYGVDPARIHVVRNGVWLDPPLADRAAWRHRLGVDEWCFLASMIANVHPYKDHATLIRAWRIVMDRMEADGRRAILLLAGRLDQAAVPQSLVADLGLSECVRFLGPVQDVAGLLGAVDLGVFSSEHEGCPNGLLECMASGLAVVATDCPGVREAIGPGADGRLAPPRDDHAMAARIVELAQDPARRAVLGEANRRRVATTFDCKAMGREMAAILGQVLNIPSERRAAG